MGGSSGKEEKQNSQTNLLLDQKEQQIQQAIRVISDKKSLTLADILSLLQSLNHAPDWNNLSETMTNLTEVMKEMASVLHTLEGTNQIEKQRIDEIYAIIEQFKELLDGTGKTFKNVKAQAYILERTMQSLIKNVNTFPQQLDPSQSDTNACTLQKVCLKEHLYVLSQWMSEECVNKTLKLWIAFHKRCQKEHHEWEILFNKTGSKKSSCQKWKKCLKMFGVGLGLVGVVVVILGFPFAGALVPCCAGVFASAGSGVLVGGIVWAIGTNFNNEQIEKLDKIQKDIQMIRSSIQVILTFGEKFRKDVKDIGDLKDITIQTFAKQIQDPRATVKERIVENSKEIVGYLRDYQCECEKMIDQVSNAESVFADVWLNIKL